MENKSMAELREMFALKANEGQDKVTSLKKAIGDHVKPGMNIYISPEGGAAICELIRQFSKTNPNFILTMIGIIDHALNLVHCGLVKKLITTNCSHIYPSPGWSKIIRSAYQKKEIEIENWTLYTHIQRLMAGALGVGFLPTKSVTDSSMAGENGDSFLVIDDPFGNRGKIGLVKALNPDIAIVHGWAADRSGNTIGVSISSQAATDHNMWGAKASKNGVIVTVEKIVSVDFLRKYSSLVALPGHLVKSVCHVPLGAHPQGMFSPVPGLFDSYAPDYEFVTEHRKACQASSEIDEWMKKWVFDCRNQDDYIEKLGTNRMRVLRDRAEKDYWEKDFQDLMNKVSTHEVPNETEIMIMVTAQKVADLMLENNYRILLGGVGVGMLSSWIAYYLLRERNYDLDLVVGTGTFGFAPRPGDPFYGTYNNLPSCKALLDTSDIYGSIIAGENKSCLSILGAGQIDKYGNINSTKIEDVFLVGSGGANDAANASQVLVVAKQSKQRFVDKVFYITCPGRNIKTLVSDMGVFEKVDGEQEFKLVACLPNPKIIDLEKRIRIIKENCNWNLRIVDDVKEYPMPGEAELSLLRLFDPERLVLNG